MDVCILPIGAYEPRWLMKSTHVNPAEAVQIHLDVQSRCSVASHWGTFPLTDEPLTEPPRLLRASLAQQQLSQDSFKVLRIGETVSFPGL